MRSKSYWIGFSSDNMGRWGDDPEYIKIATDENFAGEYNKLCWHVFAKGWHNTALTTGVVEKIVRDWQVLYADRVNNDMMSPDNLRLLLQQRAALKTAVFVTFVMDYAAEKEKK